LHIIIFNKYIHKKRSIPQSKGGIEIIHLTNPEKYDLNHKIIFIYSKQILTFAPYLKLFYIKIK